MIWITYTGLSTIIVFYLRLRSIKRPQIHFKPVHFSLCIGNFNLLVLKLILALKLSELEQFEKQAEICLFADKIEFFGKWLHPRAKLKKTDPT